MSAGRPGPAAPIRKTHVAQCQEHRQAGQTDHAEDRLKRPADETRPLTCAAGVAAVGARRGTRREGHTWRER